MNFSASELSDDDDDERVNHEFRGFDSFQHPLIMKILLSIIIVITTLSHMSASIIICITTVFIKKKKTIFFKSIQKCFSEMFF